MLGNERSIELLFFNFKGLGYKILAPFFVR
jgi:hypothetical protein